MKRAVQRMTLAEGRTCGECRLCCKLLAVGKAGEDDFKKPAGKWCKHACESGCGIQETKPAACVEYYCIWLRGLFADDHRPDRSKVIVSLEYAAGATYTADGRTVPGTDAVWCVYEQIPGVTMQRRAKLIVAELEGLLITGENGVQEGPFPICIIRSTTLVRMLKFPDSDKWIPVLRPGEVDPFTGQPDRTVYNQREIKRHGNTK